MVLRLHPNQARDRLRWQDHEPRGLDVIEAMDHHLPGIIPGKAHRQGSASGDGLHVNFHAPVLGDNNWQHVFPIQLGAGHGHTSHYGPGPLIHQAAARTPGTAADHARRHSQKDDPRFHLHSHIP